MDNNKLPDTLQVIINNIGVKPAGAISMTALHKNADVFRERFPENVEQLKNQSNIDNIGLTDLDSEKLMGKTQQADKILNHTNMKVKKWIVSEDNQDEVEVGSLLNCLIPEDEIERVLGIIWSPGRDSFEFSVRINLSPPRKKS